MDEVKQDNFNEMVMLGAIIAMVGWLMYAHTGTGEGQIAPVYWAGVATPLFSQIIKKMFNLMKK